MKKRFCYILTTAIFTMSCSQVPVTKVEAYKSFCYYKVESKSLNTKATPISLTISGVVRDYKTGNPISNAKIDFLDMTTTTDENGKYKLNHFNFEYCTYFIKVNKEGYKELNQEVTLLQNIIDVSVNMNLEPNDS